MRYRPNDDTELFVNFGQANTDLRGNGAAPLSLMDLEGRDAVYTYPDSTRNKNYYANFGGNHFVNEKLSIQGNIYYRHMERRNYNGDEFEGGDCGKDITLVEVLRTGCYVQNWRSLVVQMNRF